MKTLLLFLGLAAATPALLTGCGDKKTASHAADVSNQLSAADLATLTDFHAWRVPVPEALQPVKTIRLILFNPGDSTVVSKFSTGENLHHPNLSFILLGIAEERGAFAGHLYTRADNGGGQGWKFSFADPFTNSYAAWTVAGTLVWDGNRAEFARLTRSNMSDTILALELVK